MSAPAQAPSPRPQASPRKRSRAFYDRLVAACLGLAAASVVLAASRNQGITRDEAYYMRAGELYVTYLEEAALRIGRGDVGGAFSDALIERYYGYNPEHPALVKTLGGISWRLLHRCHCAEQAGLHPVPPKRHPTLGLVDELTAFRLPAALLAGLLASFAYLFALALAGGVAGFVAAALAILSPQLFYHAQLLCFDAPVTTFWVGTTYFYYRSLFDPRAAKWAGILFGLGFATKFNLGFLPLVLLPHWGFLWYRTRRRPPMRAFVHMAVTGTVIFFAHWPHLWHDTVKRVAWYVSFHLRHWHYNFEFLGRNYNDPPYPIYFSIVSTLFTVPVTTLALAAIGLSAPAREQRAAPRLLVGLATFLPLAVLMLPSAPIFGGVKHFLAAFPMLAVAAGVGAALIADALKASLPSLAAVTLTGALAVTAPALETHRSHPYGLSFYNALAGGYRGGAELGMNRQFWAGSTRALLPFMNQLPDGTRVYFHDMNPDMIALYRRAGLLKRGIVDAGMEEPAIRSSDYAIVIHEKHFNRYEHMIWEAYQTTRPVRVLTVEGVPLVTVYQRGAR